MVRIALISVGATQIRKSCALSSNLRGADITGPANTEFLRRTTGGSAARRLRSSIEFLRGVRGRKFCREVDRVRARDLECLSSPWDGPLDAVAEACRIVMGELEALLMRFPPPRDSNRNRTIPQGGIIGGTVVGKILDL